MYGKIFASLYQGTLRGKSDEILVFTNMIACCDRYGEVDKHPRAIADETGLPIERVLAAVVVLESPDPESRSREHEGARIARCSNDRTWGWVIVNYVKYRNIRDEETRREQNRIAVNKHRSKNKSEVIRCNKVSSDVINVIDVSQGKPMQEAEAEAEAERENTNTDFSEEKSAGASAPKKSGRGSKSYSGEFESFWAVYRKGSKLEAFAEWTKLSSEHRTLAIHGATRYLAACSASNRSLLDTVRYLRYRSWEGVYEEPREQPKPPQADYSSPNGAPIITPIYSAQKLQMIKDQLAKLEAEKQAVSA